MVEPITTIGLGAVAAYLSKDGVSKLLGPTADYLGEGLLHFTQKRVETVGKIFRTAETTLGEKLNQPGVIPPKVLKVVLDDGSFSNDDLAVEYLGGILASSRTEQGRDDRGARMAKFVDSLSTYQLRTHYLIYSTIKHLFSDKGLSLNMEDRPKMRIFIPLSSYYSGMEFSNDEQSQISSLLAHIFFGLHADNLIENHFQYGDMESIKKIFQDANDSGIICQPSALGVELFLWAFGHSDKVQDYLFNKNFEPRLVGLPKYLEGACHATF
jgi:hypothetical protein